MGSRRYGGLRETLAANVRRLRTAKGLSQEAFAEDCGLHRTQIGAVERAETNLTIDNLERIADALGVQPQLLLARPDT